MKKMTVGDLKSSNMLRVMKALRENGAASRADLARQTNLSRATLTKLTQELLRGGHLQEQLIEKARTSRTKEGRRHLLDFTLDSNYVIGIDMGGTTIRGGLANMRGDIVAEMHVPMVKYTGQEDYGEVFLRLATDLLNEKGVERSLVRAAGVAVAGTVDRQSNQVTMAPNITAFHEFDLAGIVGKALELPVIIDNDVNMAAAGEHWRGSARDCLNFIFLAIGTGIGSGVFVDGHLYRGSHNAAGEVGYMYTRGLEPIGADGLGAWEKDAAGPAIAAAARTRLSHNGGSHSALAAIDRGSLRSEDVWAAASHGDPLARDVLQEILDTLALGIANSAALLDPELIVLGGGVSQVGNALLSPLRQRLKALLPYPIAPRLELSLLGGEAQLYGAIYEALDHVDHRIAEQRAYLAPA